MWQDLRGQVYLGGEKFVTKMQKLSEKKADLSEIPRAQRRPIAKPLSHYQKQNTDRDAAMAKAYATGDYTLQEIADHFEVHYATVSRVVKRKESEQR